MIDKQKLINLAESIRIEQTESGDFFSGLVMGNHLAIDLLIEAIEEL